MQPDEPEGIKDVKKVHKLTIKRANRKAKVFNGEIQVSRGGQLDFWDQGVQIESPHTSQVKQFIFAQQNEETSLTY